MLKLCIVCNSKVPCSSKFCSCGHVFSPESRRICGKRFSGYRVGMRRQSTELSERHFTVGKMNLSAKNTARTKHLSNFKRKKIKPNVRCNGVLKENCSTKLKSKCVRKPSPQKTSRLSLALAEINRRLCGQTLFWRMLPQ